MCFFFILKLAKSSVKQLSVAFFKIWKKIGERKKRVMGKAKQIIKK